MASVCFVVYDLSIVGGVERVVEKLANRLSDRFEVHVISLHGDVINRAIHFNENVSVVNLCVSNGRLRQQMITIVPILQKYFKKEKIDVAFLEATFAGFVGCPLGILSRTKIVFCDHGALYNQLADKDITTMRKLAASLCNHIVVLTKRSKEDYKKVFNTKESKITYIYNWIDEAMIGCNHEYDSNSSIILTAGRFTKEKGFDLLIKVANQVFPKNPDWKWHIYGEGPLEEQIRTEIKRNGLENNVILMGFTDDMDSVYQSASMYVLPSYREGVPLVLLESKAHMLPCVSFDIVTGPNEIIEDKINGFLINPYETDAMADCINNMIRDSELRRELSRNSYSNITMFREETILNQWIDLINTLLRKR